MMKVLKTTVATVLLAFPMVLAADGYTGTKYFRYVNAEGVRVMSNTIPAEFVPNGYEIVTNTGRVLEVIEPAIDPELAAEQLRAREEAAKLDEWDTELRRRYSSVSDIESAKTRKLNSIDVSISILESNINSLEQQILQQQQQAAQLERGGNEIPATLLTNLENLSVELSELNAQKQQRQDEKLKMSEKYDRDIARFKVISES